ncbi:superoxide dismutase [Clostridium saccharobutylicum]|uniref:superoxide dismutase n=1 Tax=Clostridium saccharobutylicum TaxID=169679 RepID=UPI000983EEC2|nr:superoxide dismutase [Clostridium saccharobutylicum]AQS10054.1 superoxide dismutase [Clostridium saccharobutylicum]MBC2437304.1 superoxide dismutase [Clostridium saccharobutylicum]NSB89107.1 Fe-Mn family superoxide dismutase [Clostridium saccharobutylicum]NYC30961.1 Fe-Mn family superoxide dismutase [Clostridium saccharobutylicum]OOM17593.1 superoxide dismutase [Clostridium saccharobutylicum]
MKYDKIELPYSYNALEPYIDEETIRIHYTKHLQTYVDKLNKALEGYEKFTNGKTLEEILSNISKIPKSIRQTVINQGGGVANHNLYFSILSPYPKKYPEGKLLKEINKAFGTLDNLKEEINNVSINQFGSGYGWLVRDKHGKLKVLNTLNQNTPLSCGFTPILTIDIWEHAYYLKYKNLRAEYVKNIWNIINWEKVEELYK